jgi:hypothetical protein
MNVTCPAAKLEQGTLSLNKCDARCGISGLLRKAEGSPCVGDYWDCPIWMKEKQRLWANKRAAKALTMINSGTGEWN